MSHEHPTQGPQGPESTTPVFDLDAFKKDLESAGVEVKPFDLTDFTNDLESAGITVTPFELDDFVSATESVGAETETTHEDKNRVPLVFQADTFNRPLKQHEGKRLFDQDRGFLDEHLGVAFVADGMGHETGANAAEDAVNSFIQYGRTDLNGLPDSLVRGMLQSQLRQANTYVNSKIAIGYIDPKAGCTFAGVMNYTNRVGENKAAVIGVGDAVVFRVREGQIERITTEETKAARVFKAAGVYPAGIAHVITKNIGGNRDIEVEDHNVQIVDVLPGDRFIVSSDGIEKLYTDTEDYPQIPADFVRHASDDSPADFVTYVDEQMKDPKNKKPDDCFVHVVDALAA